MAESFDMVRPLTGNERKTAMIRNARVEDLDALMELYAKAKEFMKAHGNASQWTGGYPCRELLESDIEAGQLYVVEDSGKLNGVMALISGEDPTYRVIERGAWKWTEPYLTIHRIASSGARKGIFTEFLDFARSKSRSIRIDTKDTNVVMQNCLAAHGFQYAGIIHLANGDERLAFEFHEPEN